MASNDMNDNIVQSTSLIRNEFKNQRKKTSYNIPLPKTPNEVKELLKYSDHKASELISRSLKAHRNPYEAMVFLYGLSGAGKSTTLNHLFNTQLIPTSDSKSSTNEVIEYVTTMDSIHWDVNGLDIGFIDTPGWGDTSGNSINDLANIELFLASHPYLDSQQLHLKFYPNIVMIVARAGDPRILGFNSQLSKMLRVLSKLNIVDKICPNVIIVLTCALFIRPPKKYAEKRDDQIRNIKNLVRLHLGVDPPVVVVENLAEEEELEKFGDWTLLPDGTKQPLNLFEAMIALMKVSGDEIGVEAVRLLFSQGKDIDIWNRKSSEFQFGKNNPPADIQKWTNIVTTEFTALNDNEVSKEILSCVEEKRLPQLSSLTYETILPLLHKLQEVKLVTKQDLNSKNIEEINRTLDPFKLNKLEKILLFELFKVKPLDNLKNIDRLGCGFVSLEKIKLPIICSKELKYCYELGTHIPENSQFNSKGSLIVNCHFRWMKESRFSARKPVISFAVEYELFNISIEAKKLTSQQLDQTFIETVNSLPNFVSVQPNKVNTEVFRSFLDKYGTQCVLSVSYGGEINGYIDLPEGTKEDSGETYKISLLLKLFFETIQKGSNLTRLDYPSIIDENSIEMFEKLCDLPIKWRGGEDKFHSTNFRALTPIFWSCWVDTLCMKFIPLEKMVGLVDIQKIVARMNSEKYQSICKAIQAQEQEMCLENQVLAVSENPGRHEWEFIESKVIPKDYRKTAAMAAQTENTTSMCAIL